MASIERRERGGRNGTPKFTVHSVVWRDGADRPRATMDSETDAEIMLALVNAAGNKWPAADDLRARGLGYLLGDGDGEDDAPAPVTFDQHAAAYFDRRKKAGRINGSTPERYAQRHALHVSPYLGHLPLVEITPQILLDWQYMLIESKGLAPKTVLNVRGEIVNPVLKDAMRLGPNNESPLLDRNPLDAVDAPQRRPVHRPIIDGEAESKLFLRACYERVKGGRFPHVRRSAADLAVVQLLTGLRWSEIAPLRVEQVNRTTREIDVCRTVERRFVDPVTGRRRSHWVLREHGKTDAATRTTTYPPELDALMRALCEGRPPGAYLFPGPGALGFWQYESWYGHWRQIKAALLKLGFPKAALTPHGLRHSALSALIAHAVDLVTLRHIAGHASISTTVNIYGKPTRKGLAAAQVALSPLGVALDSTRQEAA